MISFPQAGLYRQGVRIQLHFLDPDSAADGVFDGGEPFHHHAFLDRLFDFEVARRHFVARAAKDDDRFCAHAPGGAGHVYGGVAAAVDDHPWAEHGLACRYRPRADAAPALIAKNKKMGQTRAQFNGVSNGGSIGPLSDAEDQANEAKNQEAARRDSQAREEDEAAGRQNGQRRRHENGRPLAVFQLALGTRAASNCDPLARQPPRLAHPPGLQPARLEFFVELSDQHLLPASSEKNAALA